MDNTRFRSTKHFERYNQFYQKALIIQERLVDLVDLKDYFIPNFFQNKGQDKLLGDLPRVYEPLIRELYANAILREDEINCWIRGHEFTIDLEDIEMKFLVLRSQSMILLTTRTECFPQRRSNLILVESEREDASTLLLFHLI